MQSEDSAKEFKTLKGFINNEEEDEEIYFSFMASLRIYGDDIPFDEISQRLGVRPTSSHRKGEPHRLGSIHTFENDSWHFEAPLPESEPLERHIEALWLVVKPEVEYLKSLKNRLDVDVFCGYRSNCDHAGFEVSHTVLELFTALEIPFGVSVIIA